MEKLTFVEACSAIHKRVLQEDFDKEIKEDSYLPQSAFNGCGHRANGLLHRANRAVENFANLCILMHREGHDEEREEEKTALVAVMEVEQPQDITTAQLYSFWMG